MTDHKTRYAQTEIQEQSPKTSTTYQVIYRAIKQSNEESKEQGWKSHLNIVY
jgi:hypothetical protein